MKKIISALLGSVTGFVNGLLGSGGGVIAVPMLEKAGLETKKSHASSIAITLPLSIVSTVFYSIKGTIDWKTSIILVIPGLIGTVIGVIFLKKIPNILLKRIFGIILIISGIRMFFI